MTHHFIRTVAELEALHPDTILIDNDGDIDPVRNWLNARGEADPWLKYYLPAAVIATGAQVRAARKALEDAS